MPTMTAVLSPAALAALAGETAASPGRWSHLVRYRSGHRWYRRLDTGNRDYELWLLSWLPGQQTGFHDHGDAAGAFAVATGELLESTARPGGTAVAGRTVTAGSVRSFGPAYVHDVRNVTAARAVSVHAYSPPLSLMRRYEMTGSGLVLAGTETARAGW